MRVLRDKSDYKLKDEFVVSWSSIKCCNGNVFHPGLLAKTHRVYTSWVEIAYETYIEGSSHLFEVAPDMFKNAFRHAYKNERKRWLPSI